MPSHMNTNTKTIQKIKQRKWKWAGHTAYLKCNLVYEFHVRCKLCCIPLLIKIPFWVVRHTLIDSMWSFIYSHWDGLDRIRSWLNRRLCGFIWSIWYSVRPSIRHLIRFTKGLCYMNLIEQVIFLFYSLELHNVGVIQFSEIPNVSLLLLPHFLHSNHFSF
jgi:hypothetical protein